MSTKEELEAKKIEVQAKIDRLALSLEEAFKLWDIVEPTTKDTLDLYSRVTGYDPNAKPDAHGKNPTDKGTDMDELCDWLEKNLFMGDKQMKHVHLDPNNLAHIKWGVILCGTFKAGVRLPSNAERQFDAHTPWDVSFFSYVEGGHDIPIIGYDRDYLYCVTWGRIQPMTWRWFHKYCDIAIVTLNPEWLRKAGVAPSGFKADQLMADMNHLEA